MGIELLPCPACGGKAREGRSLGDYPICQACWFSAIPADWNRLSRAARLLAAVEGLGVAIQQGCTLTVRYEEDRCVVHLKNAPANRGLLFGKETFTDALIALANEVTQ